MRRIDEALFPPAVPHGTQRRPAENRSLVTTVITEVEQIKYLLANMFDRLTDLEVGRDVLTQLFNRRFLPTILKREIELNRRKKTSFCVLMLDIDFFKRVNDQYGHDAGDRVLQHVAGLLIGQVRASDFVFRYGGEEFLVVLAELDAIQAGQVAEKIRSRVEATEIPLSDEHTVRLTLSIGIAPHTGHPDFEHLVARADKALFAAKDNGRNRCELAPA